MLFRFIHLRPILSRNWFLILIFSTHIQLFLLLLLLLLLILLEIRVRALSLYTLHWFIRIILIIIITTKILLLIRLISIVVIGYMASVDAILTEVEVLLLLSSSAHIEGIGTTVGFRKDWIVVSWFSVVGRIFSLVKLTLRG